MASRAIRILHWGQVFEDVGMSWRHAGGCLFAVWPAPIGADACFEAAGFSDFDGGDDDALDPEWQALIERAIAFLERNYGPPRQSSGAPAFGNKPGLIARFLRIGGAARSRVPLIAERAIAERVLISTCDDQLPETIVEFGAEAPLKLRASDGHRILWISTGRDVTFEAGAFAQILADDRPICETPLDWRRLMR